MKRLDHSMIFLFIAGTYTPFSLLAVDQPRGYWVLAGVWAGALAGVVLKLSWPTAPRWVGVPLYIGLGWVAVFILTDILHIAGVTSLVLLAVGGLLYTVGGVAYGIRKPNPWPGTFGYHEVFHAMTIVAATCHHIAVYFAMYNSPFRLTPSDDRGQEPFPCCIEPLRSAPRETLRASPASMSRFVAPARIPPGPHVEFSFGRPSGPPLS